jgi:hypothetical protein
MDQIVNAAEQSHSLVQVELRTTGSRSSTHERITGLNARLRASHGADFERERLTRKEQANVHEAGCRQRTLAHQHARALINQLLS